MTSELDENDESRYEVTSGREILKLLRGIAAQNVLVTLEFKGGEKLILTSILAVDEAENLVTVDLSQKADLNAMILASSRIIFNCVHEKIRILFPVTGIASCSHEGSAALCFELPQSLTRLQRRDDFRVATSLTAPIYCLVKIATEASPNAGKQEFKLDYKPGRTQAGTALVTLSNISASGLALIDDKKLIPTATGTILDTCQIIIPNQPAINLALEVCNVTDLSIADGRKVRKLGCRIADIGKADQNSVLRLIATLERAEIARVMGTK